MADVQTLWFFCTLAKLLFPPSKLKHSKREQGGEGGIEEGLENKAMWFWFALQELKGGPFNL